MITSGRSQVTRSVLCFVCKCGHICAGSHPLPGQLHPLARAGAGQLCSSAPPTRQLLLWPPHRTTPPPQTNCYCYCCSQTVKLVSSSLKQHHGRHHCRSAPAPHFMVSPITSVTRIRRQQRWGALNTTPRPVTLTLRRTADTVRSAPLTNRY